METRVRRLTEREALLLGALRLQALRARGESPAAGMVDRLARQVGAERVQRGADHVIAAADRED
ncbi:hypothetical protein, partial [Ornithinicoccus halotolerans]|uniref:hypothetical protein n=1 Tax=Ornithinicoccus halotolerans TaxID=1748220 RepID=UPI001294C543